MSPRKKPAKKQTKRRKAKRLSPAQWETIRIKWSEGGGTFEVLSKEFGVTVSAIKKRSQREQWKQRKPEHEEKVRQTTEEILIKLGMPKEKFLRMMLRSAKKIEKQREEIVLVKPPPKKIGKGKNAKLVEQAPIAMRRTVKVPDNYLMLEYRKEIAKLVGWYSAPKATVRSDDGQPETEIPIITHIKRVEDPNAKENSNPESGSSGQGSD